MRGFLKPIAALPLAVLALSSTGGLARAQQSADSIINALKPTGNLSTGATRGIKLGGSPAAQSAPSAGRPVSATGTAARPRPTTQEANAPVAGPSVNVTVNFPTGSAELTPAAKASLELTGQGTGLERPREVPVPDRGTHRHGRVARSEPHIVAAKGRGGRIVSDQSVQCRAGPPAGGRHGGRTSPDRHSPADTGSPQPARSGHKSGRLTRPARNSARSRNRDMRSTGPSQRRGRVCW